MVYGTYNKFLSSDSISLTYITFIALPTKPKFHTRSFTVMFLTNILYTFLCPTKNRKLHSEKNDNVSRGPNGLVIYLYSFVQKVGVVTRCTISAFSCRN